MTTSDFPVLPEWKRAPPSVWGEQDAVAWLRGCPWWMGWAGLVGVALVDRLMWVEVVAQVAPSLIAPSQSHQGLTQ